MTIYKKQKREKIGKAKVKLSLSGYSVRPLKEFALRKT